MVVDRYGDNQVVRIERGHGDTEIHEAEPLPEGREDIAKELVHHFETGDPLHQTLQMMFNLEAMAILDAGVRSAATDKLELVDNETWCIG